MCVCVCKIPISARKRDVQTMRHHRTGKGLLLSQGLVKKPLGSCDVLLTVKIFRMFCRLKMFLSIIAAFYVL